MKKIKLSNSNRTAIVDDSDFKKVSKYKWSLHKNGHANGWRTEGGKKQIWVKMHSLILRKKPGLIVDHRDHDRLNNSRKNLRYATKSQNGQNMAIRGGKKTSKYKGVSWCKRLGKWIAYITHNYKFIYLGISNQEKLAAEMYNKAASKLFGEFAYLNPL